tara:strand:- start:15152 stop:16333 length:1182 start_codon:yes stop_codon:yes gene_type:complete
LNKIKLECLAIIPARGGSKGIPGKNVKKINGKPLIVWTIETAKKSVSVDRVIVSTDDDDICNVAKKYGAEVVIRPSELSQDGSSSEEALLHCLSYLKNKESYVPDVVMFLQCTSPLFEESDIDSGLNSLIENKLDSSFASIEFHHFLWKQSNNKYVGINHNEEERLLRQERNSEYLEAGAIYIMKTNSFLKYKHRFCGLYAPFVIDKYKFVDIDDIDDFYFAEKMLKAKNVRDSFQFIPKAIVMDFDGVHTNNQVLVSDDGREIVSCSRSDGYGLELIKRHTNIKLLIISKEKNDVVKRRAEKLNIELIFNCNDKLPELKKWCCKNSIQLDEVFYIGNDLNDSECMDNSGMGIAVADAHKDLLNVADYVLTKNGGDGAIREVVDLILEKRENV